MRIILVRHAKSEINKRVKSSEWGLVSGYENEPLLEEIKTLANYRRIYSSDEQKAILTTEVLSSGQEIIKSKWLREVERGSKFLENYADRVSDFFNYPEKSVDEWETAQSAYKRFSEGLQKIEFSAGEDILLVGHGLLFSLFRAKALNREKVKMEEWHSILMPDYAIFEKEAANYRLIKDFEGITDTKIH